MGLGFGSFLPNVLSSLVAGIILLLGAPVISRKARYIFTAVTTRLLNLDVQCIFEDKSEAARDLQSELKRSTSIRILTGRGSELQRSAFESIFTEPNDQRGRKVTRIMQPDTGTDDKPNYWTAQREKELAIFELPYENSGLLARQIESNVEHLTQHITAGMLELRRFDIPHQGRIILTNRYAYYTPYSEDKHGRNSVVYKFIRGGAMYENLSRLFEQLWEADRRRNQS